MIAIHATRPVDAIAVDTLRHQGFTRAICVIALHEAGGFRRAGVYREVGYKQGRGIDIGIWQCGLNERRVPPVQSRRFADTRVGRA